jgi:hypothetical protein
MPPNDPTTWSVSQLANFIGHSTSNQLTTHNRGSLRISHCAKPHHRRPSPGGSPTTATLYLRPAFRIRAQALWTRPSAGSPKSMTSRPRVSPVRQEIQSFDGRMRLATRRTSAPERSATRHFSWRAPVKPIVSKGARSTRETGPRNAASVAGSHNASIESA